MNSKLETFKYDNRIVRAFAIATVVWGVVGMLVGLLAAVQLFFPDANLNFQFITFGRIRPLHTNAVIFAFVGNGMFMGIYYSLQRLCKARMFSDFISWFHFWGWQSIIVAAAITLPLGLTTSKEYAELEWPIKIAIAVVWVAFTPEGYLSFPTDRWSLRWFYAIARYPEFVSAFWQSLMLGSISSAIAVAISLRTSISSCNSARSRSTSFRSCSTSFSIRAV